MTPTFPPFFFFNTSVNTFILEIYIEHLVIHLDKSSLGYNIGRINKIPNTQSYNPQPFLW